MARRSVSSFHGNAEPAEARDAEKREAVSDDIMLYVLDLEPDSDFGPVRPEIVRL